MWIAEEAFSAHLSPRDTKLRGGSPRTCAENHAALVDNAHSQTAVSLPPFSTTEIDGQHDRFGSAFLFSWQEASEVVGIPHLDDVYTDRALRC